MIDKKMILYTLLEKQNPTLNSNELKIKIDFFLDNFDKININYSDTSKLKKLNFSNYNKILEIAKLSKKKIHFNDYFMMLYLYSNSYLSSYKIGNWNIFSLSKVITDFSSLLHIEPNIEWLCLGSQPFGITQYHSLRMNINNGKLFIQSDGGNNDNEIEENWQKYKNQDLLLVDYIDFPNLFYLLSSKIYESH